jgi:hypothetical protein
MKNKPGSYGATKKKAAYELQSEEAELELANV